MSDFASADLLAYGKARYLETVLRNRMRGAAGDEDAADIELSKIAESVIARVRSAAQVSVGWPLPEVDPDTSVAYRAAWPKNLLQHALELFNWRTLAGFEQVSPDQRKIGEAAEAYFDALADGSEAWGIATSGDTGVPLPVAARDRAGNANIAGLGIYDRRNLFGELAGAGWDYVH